MDTKKNKPAVKEYIPYMGIFSEAQLKAGLERFKKIVHENRERARQISDQSLHKTEQSERSV